eukprot:3336149-Rhodomonas_salina.2
MVPFVPVSWLHRNDAAFAPLIAQDLTKGASGNNRTRQIAAHHDGLRLGTAHFVADAHAARSKRALREMHHRALARPRVLQLIVCIHHNSLRLIVIEPIRHVVRIRQMSGKIPIGEP